MRQGKELNMKLDYLGEMKLAYKDLRRIHPYGGDEGRAFGTGDGTFAGDRVRGTVRWVNHPRQRSDGTWLPDAHGVIETEDGAVIMFSLQGRTVFPTEDIGRQLLSIAFEAEDERYKWLNTTWCMAEGLIAEGAMRSRVYSCVNELV